MFNKLFIHNALGNVPPKTLILLYVYIVKNSKFDPHRSRKEHANLLS